MNAIPQKPFAADPAVAPGSKAATEAGNVRLTIDFEDDPEAERDGTPKAFAPADGPAMGMPGEDGAGAHDPGSSRGTAAAAEPGMPPPGSAARRAAAPADAGEPAAAERCAKSPPVPPQLAGIEVTLTVEIGAHRLPLKDLLSVDPGQLFALDRMTSEPVSILVNGKPFARGEIVAIGDRFGVRLLDIVAPGSL